MFYKSKLKTIKLDARPANTDFLEMRLISLLASQFSLHPRRPPLQAVFAHGGDAGQAHQLTHNAQCD